VVGLWKSCWSPMLKVLDSRLAKSSENFLHAFHISQKFLNVWYTTYILWLRCKFHLPVNIMILMIINLPLGVDRILPSGYSHLKRGFFHLCQVCRDQEGQKYYD